MKKEQYQGQEFELRKMSGKWMFVIEGYFRTPFYSKLFDTKPEARHSAIELIAAIQNRLPEQE